MVLDRHGLLTHYCNNCNLLLYALTVVAVTVTDPARSRAVIDGIAMTIAALANIRLTGEWQSHAGRKLVQRTFAEVR